ncbi:MAG: DegT/DnrJ/EryC1/StrS family aminotransferase [Sphaerochaeta sp.]|nr:MAG: DegT/DnrJ/EryC1/StrS family aminotransferase [Sphaerochaeta sp.]
MEFRDLKKQYQVLKPKMDQAVIEVMESSQFIGGPKVKELEERLASYVGVKHCITCGNGTDALTMVLKAWGIKEGDAVFVPSFTFFASAEVVSFEGATPVFVDVDRDTFNIDVHSLEAAIKAVLKEGKLTPRVVMPVDLFGLPADYDAIQRIADKYDLLVLEDGAQGFGGTYKGKRACSFGDAATTSFFPAKPLGCYGDGGAVFTNDDETAAYIRSLAVHGKGEHKYDNVRIGWNSRLDAIQAAILLVKLDAFEEYELKDVDQVAQWYTELLKDKVKTPIVPEGYTSSWAQYTITLKNEQERDRMIDSLKEQGIPTIIYYPKPLHRQTVYKNQRLYVPCPVSEELSRTVVSLPMDPYKEKEALLNRVTRELDAGGGL